ncbi:hypothetical protein TMatcc_002828 [Talaromyces marneffei ATCC 18224]|uniref:Aspergillopepsin-2, putative n=2 Tax=Talaromyces marneffei TaxID=37727 RepID=B6Q7T6_TALMQ|nr:uncharacterized protein EYB26_002087 [Talaromyces marneffei]EEA28821.1 aspergillopepsin-2 precursor, putative [Talaromyces marneffei ATCC 18224]KAE8555569.1 hypothetical protein EYB25_000266 [Talaromyces marneffei]QGA14433.1 hypothetical protein EYB26_002087 [Talaromyces marneffei]
MPSISKFMPLLLASTALAMPRSARRGLSTNERPGVYTNSTRPSIAATIDYTDSNWAGAVTEETQVTHVSGAFEIPRVYMPAGGDPSTSYCGTAWVGIDGWGNDCNGGLIQAGVNWCIQNGAVTYTPWSEWWPAEYQINFDNFEVSQGDLVSVSVTATSTNSGYAVLTNTATGASVTRTWSNESPGLCLRTAEWIVEDFSLVSSSGSSLAPFANFGQVYWTDTNCEVNGQSWGAANSNIADMVQGNNVLATAYLKGNDVIINYGTGY